MTSNVNEKKSYISSDGGAAAVEYALCLPVLLALLQLVLGATVGFNVSNKVEDIDRTLVDLTAQQSDVSLQSQTYTCGQIFGAASLMIAPFDASSLSMVLSEVELKGDSAGTVSWSASSGSATPLTVGATVVVPASFSASQNVIVGTVMYNYAPLAILMPGWTVGIDYTLYMTPRVADAVVGPAPKDSCVPTPTPTSSPNPSPTPTRKCFLGFCW